MSWLESRASATTIPRPRTPGRASCASSTRICAEPSARGEHAELVPLRISHHVPVDVAPTPSQQRRPALEEVVHGAVDVPVDAFLGQLVLGPLLKGKAVERGPGDVPAPP